MCRVCQTIRRCGVDIHLTEIQKMSFDKFLKAVAPSEDSHTIKGLGKVVIKELAPVDFIAYVDLGQKGDEAETRAFLITKSLYYKGKRLIPDDQMQNMVAAISNRVQGELIAKILPLNGLGIDPAKNS